MGDPKRQHKQYARPKTAFSKARIEEEKLLIKKFGLKNKKEIWKAESCIGRIRNQAKKLILQPEKQEAFLSRLKALGLVKQDASIDDVLALAKEKLLERRLQTIIFCKGIVKTPREARQLISHKKIKIGDKIINLPGYIIKIKEENMISLKEGTRENK